MIGPCNLFCKFRSIFVYNIRYLSIDNIPQTILELFSYHFILYIKQHTRRLGLPQDHIFENSERRQPWLCQSLPAFSPSLQTSYTCPCNDTKISIKNLLVQLSSKNSKTVQAKTRQKFMLRIFLLFFLPTCSGYINLFVCNYERDKWTTPPTKTINTIVMLCHLPGLFITKYFNSFLIDRSSICHTVQLCCPLDVHIKHLKIEHKYLT